ncbi:dTDP-4-dehydrorhamnose 3,5-epimerase family protein [Candidatus Daviesbacteria bacterium]|nr:dTDP-4-dehydrorhamnose 3,5-epimerase family protein [Candidatus Daviesbacteria bacterium]
MENKYIAKTSIPGLLMLERPEFSDKRGFFREIFHLDELEKELGFKFKPIQMNHSRSMPRVIRGLHAEQWNKMIYPVNGTAFLAVVDLRPDSPTFAKVETFTIDDGQRYGLFIPNGLANSVCVVGDEPVDYIYLTDTYWDGSDTRAIVWDDPDLKIDWPVKNPIISERDKNNPRLRDLFKQVVDEKGSH